jgi:hypothetical protein
MTDSEKLREIADVIEKEGYSKIATAIEKVADRLDGYEKMSKEYVELFAEKLQRETKWDDDQKPAISAEEFLKGCEHDGSYIPVNEVIRLMKGYASQFSLVVLSDGELLTDDCDMRDTKLSMFVGGNGDYYLQLTESKGDDIISLCTRISMSGGIASIDTKLAIANLYRALNGKPLIVPSDKERLQKAIKALKMIANWNDDLEDEWGDPGEAANHALRQILKNNG